MAERNPSSDSSGSFNDPDTHVVAHDMFHVVATMNPGGDFGKRELSPALRNRFTEIWVPSTLHLTDLRMVVKEQLARYSGGSVRMANAKDVLPMFAEPMLEFVTWFNDQNTLMRTGIFLTLRDILCWVNFMHSAPTHAFRGDGAQSEAATSPEHNSETRVLRAYWSIYFNGAALVALDGIGVNAACPVCVSRRLQVRSLGFLLNQVFRHLEWPNSNSIDKVALCKSILRDVSLSMGLHEHPPGTNQTYGCQKRSRLRREQSNTPKCKSLNEHIIDDIASNGNLFGKYPCFIECGQRPRQWPRYALDAPTTSRNLIRLLRALQLKNRPILLEGSPGVGKTSLVTALACASGHHLVRINLSEQTDIADLLGADLPAVYDPGAGTQTPGAAMDHVSGGDNPHFVWNDGVLLKALRNGQWVLLDELNLAPQPVLEGLNAILDHRAAAYVPEIDQVVECPETFRVFATQNPLREGGGRRGLPKSFLNRFTKVYISALHTEDLRFISRSLFPNLAHTRSPITAQHGNRSCDAPFIMDKIIAFNAAVHADTMTRRVYGRHGWPWEFNLRDVFRCCELIDTTRADSDQSWLSFSLQEAVHLLYTLRMRTEFDRRKISSRFAQILSGNCGNPSCMGCPTCVDAQVRHFGGAVSRSATPIPVEHASTTTHFLQVGKAILSRRLGRMTPFSTVGITGALSVDGCGTNKVALRDLYGPMCAIATCVERRWPCLLVGPSASGKTSSLRNLAALAGQTCHEVAMNSGTDSTELLGSFEQFDIEKDTRACNAAMDSLLSSSLEALILQVVACSDESAQQVTSHILAVQGLLWAFRQRVVSETLVAKSELNAVRIETMNLITRGLDASEYTISLLEQCARIVPKQRSSGPVVDPWFCEGASRTSALKELLRVARHVANRVYGVLSKSHQCQSQLQRGPHADILGACGRFEWVDGVLLRAMERGDWIILDNANLCSPTVLDRLNPLLEPGGKLLVNECGLQPLTGRPRVVTPHPRFRLFLSIDPHHGELSRAMRNRCVEIAFLSPRGAQERNEFNSLSSRAGKSANTCQHVQGSRCSSIDALRLVNIAGCLPGTNLPHLLVSAHNAAVAVTAQRNGKDGGDPPAWASRVVAPTRRQLAMCASLIADQVERGSELREAIKRAFELAYGRDAVLAFRSNWENGTAKSCRSGALVPANGTNAGRAMGSAVRALLSLSLRQAAQSTNAVRWQPRCNEMGMVSRMVASDAALLDFFLDAGVDGSFDHVRSGRWRRAIDDLTRIVTGTESGPVGDAMGDLPVYRRLVNCAMDIFVRRASVCDWQLRVSWARALADRAFVDPGGKCSRNNDRDKRVLHSSAHAFVAACCIEESLVSLCSHPIVRALQQRWRSLMFGSSDKLLTIVGRAPVLLCEKGDIFDRLHCHVVNSCTSNVGAKAKFSFFVPDVWRSCQTLLAYLEVYHGRLKQAAAELYEYASANRPRNALDVGKKCSIAQVSYMHFSRRYTQQGNDDIAPLVYALVNGLDNIVSSHLKIVGTGIVHLGPVHKLSASRTVLLLELMLRFRDALWRVMSEGRVLPGNDRDAGGLSGIPSFAIHWRRLVRAMRPLIAVWRCATSPARLRSMASAVSAIAARIDLAVLRAQRSTIRPNDPASGVCRLVAFDRASGTSATRRGYSIDPLRSFAVTPLLNEAIQLCRRLSMDVNNISWRGGGIFSGQTRLSFTHGDEASRARHGGTFAPMYPALYDGLAATTITGWGVDKCGGCRVDALNALSTILWANAHMSTDSNHCRIVDLDKLSKIPRNLASRIRGLRKMLGCGLHRSPLHQLNHVASGRLVEEHDDSDSQLVCRAHDAESMPVLGPPTRWTQLYSDVRKRWVECQLSPIVDHWSAGEELKLMVDFLGAPWNAGAEQAKGYLDHALCRAEQMVMTSVDFRSARPPSDWAPYWQFAWTAEHWRRHHCHGVQYATSHEQYGQQYNSLRRLISTFWQLMLCNFHSNLGGGTTILRLHRTPRTEGALSVRDAFNCPPAVFVNMQTPLVMGILSNFLGVNFRHTARGVALQDRRVKTHQLSRLLELLPRARSSVRANATADRRLLWLIFERCLRCFRADYCYHGDQVLSFDGMLRSLRVAYTGSGGDFIELSDDAVRVDAAIRRLSACNDRRFLSLLHPIVRPMLLCFASLRRNTHDERITMALQGKCWAFVGLLQLHLLFPFHAHGPTVGADVETTKHRIQCMNDEITVRVWANHLSPAHGSIMPAQRVSTISGSLPIAAARMNLHRAHAAPAPVCAFTHRKRSDSEAARAVDMLLNEVHQFTESFGSIHRVTDLVENMCRGNLDDQKNTLWQQAALRFLQRLQTLYAASVPELATPVAAAVYQLCHGLRMVHQYTPQSSLRHTQSRLKYLHCSLLAMPSGINVRCFGERNLSTSLEAANDALRHIAADDCGAITKASLKIRVAMLKAQLLRCEIQLCDGDEAIHCATRKSLHAIFDAFAEEWRLTKAVGKRKDSSVSTIYFFRKEHDVIDNQEECDSAVGDFRTMFPDYASESLNRDEDPIVGNGPLTASKKEPLIDEAKDPPQRYMCMEHDTAAFLSRIQNRICSMLRYTSSGVAGARRFTGASDVQRHECYMHQREVMSMMLDLRRQQESRTNFVGGDTDGIVIGGHMYAVAVAALQCRGTALDSEDISCDAMRDFYHDPAIDEVRRAEQPLLDFIDRVHGLFQSWPGNSVLKQLLRSSNRLLRLPFSAPIAQMLCGIELLLSKSHEWEESASSDSSLKAVLGPLSQIVLRWRKLELGTWPYLLDREEKRHAYAALRWWFHLHEIACLDAALIDGEKARTSGEDGICWAHLRNYQRWLLVGHGKNRCARERKASTATTVTMYLDNLSANLNSFIRLSPIGEFVSRLRMLYALASMLKHDSRPPAKCGCETTACPANAIAARTSLVDSICHIVYGTYRFYAQHIRAVEGHVSSVKEPLLAKLRTHAKVTRWDERTFFALRESAEKSHRVLHKIASAYYEALGSSTDSILEPAAARAVDFSDIGTSRIWGLADAEHAVSTAKATNNMQLSFLRHVSRLPQRKAGGIHSIGGPCQLFSPPGSCRFIGRLASFAVRVTQLPVGTVYPLPRQHGDEGGLDAADNKQHRQQLLPESLQQHAHSVLGGPGGMGTVDASTMAWLRGFNSPKDVFNAIVVRIAHLRPRKGAPILDAPVLAKQKAFTDLMKELGPRGSAGIPILASTVPDQMRNVRNILELPAPVIDQALLLRVGPASAVHRAMSAWSRADQCYYASLGQLHQLRTMVISGTWARTQSDLGNRDVNRCLQFAEGFMLIVLQQRQLLRSLTLDLDVLLGISMQLRRLHTSLHRIKCTRVTTASSNVDRGAECVDCPNTLPPQRAMRFWVKWHKEQLSRLFTGVREFQLMHRTVARAKVVAPPNRNHTDQTVETSAGIESPGAAEGTTETMLDRALQAICACKNTLLSYANDGGHSGNMCERFHPAGDVAENSSAGVPGSRSTCSATLLCSAGNDSKNCSSGSAANIFTRMSVSAMLSIFSRISRIIYPCLVAAQRSSSRKKCVPTSATHALVALASDMASRKDVFLREVVQRCGRAPRALPRRTLPEHFASAADSTVKSLLLSIQGACSQFRQLGDKVGQRGIPGSEQSSMVRHHSLCMNVAQQLRLPEINIGVSILIRAVDASANGDENTGPRTMLDAGDCVAVTAVAAALLPFVRAVCTLGGRLLTGCIFFHDSVSKLNIALLRIFRVLCEKGFCRPRHDEQESSDSSPDNNGAADGDVTEGVGMGTGEGARDVTNEIMHEEQLLGLDEEDGAAEEETQRGSGADEGMEMEQAFEGTLEDVDREEPDNESDADDEAESIGHEFGDVDEAVDEVMWGGGADDASLSEGTRDAQSPAHDGGEPRGIDSNSMASNSTGSLGDDGRAGIANNSENGSTAGDIDRDAASNHGSVNEPKKDSTHSSAESELTDPAHDAALDNEGSGSQPQDGEIAESNSSVDDSEVRNKTSSEERNEGGDDVEEDKEVIEHDFGGGEDTDSKDGEQFESGNVEENKSLSGRGGDGSDGVSGGEKDSTLGAAADSPGDGMNDERGGDPGLGSRRIGHDEEGRSSSTGNLQQSIVGDIENMDTEQDDSGSAPATPEDKMGCAPTANQSAGTDGRTANEHGTTNAADADASHEIDGERIADGGESAPLEPSPHWKLGDVEKYWHRRLELLQHDRRDNSENPSTPQEGKDRKGNKVYEIVDTTAGNERSAPFENEQILAPLAENINARVLKEMEVPRGHDDAAIPGGDDEGPRLDDTGRNTSTSPPQTSNESMLHELSARSRREPVGDAAGGSSNDTAEQVQKLLREGTSAMPPGGRTTTGATRNETSVAADTREDAAEQPSGEMHPPGYERSASVLNVAHNLWREYCASTNELSQRLCEQLRLLLEPLVAAKLQGDYSTGKRINMRRVISYIASQFKNDKIWLRRTKPSKRHYQVMVAIDDSESMSAKPDCTGAGHIACEALALITNAMVKLEVGDVAIASFGSERVRLLHDFGAPFNHDAGANVLTKFTFSQKWTNWGRSLENIVSIFDAARHRVEARIGGRKKRTMQLLFVISDGRIDSDRSAVHYWTRIAIQKGILPVLLVCDGRVQQQHSDKHTARPSEALDSISQLVQWVKSEDGNLIPQSYLQAYPFPYYLLIRNINGLPEALADALRQWFELMSQL